MARTRRPRRTPERHRQAAIDVLANTLQALDPERMGGDSRSVSKRIATEFVDALTTHIIESVDALLTAREAVKRGGK